MIKVNQDVHIPNDWISHLTQTDKFAVLLKNNPAMFRLVTTKHPEVTEFYLDLEVLQEDFLELMFKKIESFKIKPIYSSGVCFVEDTCYYLFLIDGDPDQITKDGVVTALKEIQGVVDVLIRSYSMD